jgi:mRNA-degrading endonuclease toxin of MazEF toxin-antitoxin module
MKVCQGDIVEVVFPAPGNKSPHPVLVVSNEDFHEAEEAFIAVLISSTAPDDEYSFHLEKEMLLKPTKKPCQVRTHLISLFQNTEIIQKVSSLKKAPLQKVIEKIKYSIF